MFSSIRTVLLKALISPVRCFRVITGEEDFTLLTITNNVFRFVDLRKEDVSVIYNSKR